MHHRSSSFELSCSALRPFTSLPHTISVSVLQYLTLHNLIAQFTTKVLFHFLFYLCRIQFFFSKMGKGGKNQQTEKRKISLEELGKHRTPTDGKFKNFNESVGRDLC